VRENDWRGELRDSAEAVLGYAGKMTYKGRAPVVQRVTKEYPKGVRRTKAEQKETEKAVQRKAGLEKWMVEIPPLRPDQGIT